MPLEGPDMLLYEKKDHIVTIKLNRPERMNTFTPELFDMADEAWSRFQNDDDAWVAILTAEGDRAFCTGMDLKEQARRVAEDPSFDIVKLKPGVLEGNVGSPRGNNVTKPVIAAVNGIATAGGFQLTMQSDLRIASENAKFGIAEVKAGRGTPWAVPIIWQMPMPMIMEIFTTGTLMPAQRLYEVGWINKVVPLDQLMDTAWEYAEILATNAPLSVRAAKVMFSKVVEEITEKGLAMAKEIYEPVYASEDAVEGPRAFAEKRKPQWKGR
jgi:enoyl-CoA hydratase